MILFNAKLLIRLFHYLHICNDGKFSFTKQSQNIFENAWIAFHLILLSFSYIEYLENSSVLMHLDH